MLFGGEAFETLLDMEFVQWLQIIICRKNTFVLMPRIKIGNVNLFLFGIIKN